VVETGDYIAFLPANAQPTAGLIFYPGGRVDYRAYAPLLRKVAAQGYLVAVVPVTLNLAFFDLEAGAPVLAAFPEIKTWAAGGHSLGGVAASIFAQRRPQIGGLVLLASTPADDSLKYGSLRVLSVSGSLDGLFPPQDLEASRALLPTSSTFLLVDGGNHAQFGDYGPQSGDNPAAIGPEEQWEQTARLIAEFLQTLER
jgi:pimeloyl-ACP methyl ester carboxylesterase